MYLRKSRAEKNDPDVLSKHREALLRASRIAEHRIAPEDMLEEVGSGEYLHTRPVFRRLLEQLEATPRGGGHLWVMDVDRLARGEQTERAYVGKIIATAGVLVWTASGGMMDLRDPDQRLLFQVKGDLAENELGKYKHRVRQAWDSMLREGRVRNGKVPTLGYRWDRNEQRVVTTAEFAILQALLQDAFHLSIDRLVAKYGLPPNVVKQIIRNPFVCGYPARRWVKSSPEMKGSIRLPGDQWVWPEKPGDYPVAISREEWERLQLHIDRRLRGRDTYRSSKGWCRDVLRFVGGPDQPALLGTHSYPGYHAETYELIPAGQKRLYVPRVIVHEAAEAAIRQALGRAEVLACIQATWERRRGAKKRSSIEAAAASRELAALRSDLTKLEARELRVEDEEDRLAISALRKEIKAKIAACKRDLEAAAHGDETPDLTPIVGAVEKLRMDWAETWTEMPDPWKRQAANLFLRRILVAIQPIEGERKHAREVVDLEYQAWIPS